MLESTPRAIYESWLVTIYDPSSISANFHSLELIMLLGALLTLRHALRERRIGRPFGLLLWLTALFYGVWMELLAYNVIDNFGHAQFTVMFYGKQLPLYVVLLYPAFIYVAATAARKLKAGALATFFTAGLLAMLLDVPFDIMGPDCGWWVWYEGGGDPYGLVEHRWLGVPVSSYCWHVLFGGSAALIGRHFDGRISPRIAGQGLLRSLLTLIPTTGLLGALTVLLGVLVMMPFHLFRAVGLTDGHFTVSLLVTAALALLLSRNRDDAGPPVWGLLGWVMAWYFYYLALGWQVWEGGEVGDWQAKALVFGAVSVLAVVLHTIAHFRGDRR